MQKPKIYLDTSTISHLEQAEKPSEQGYSRDLFASIKAGRFEVYLSSVVFDEIDECSPQGRGALLNHVAEIRFNSLTITDSVNALARMIIDKKVLPPKSERDSYHIAAAIIAGCDYIVSWNMKHMANVKINKKVRHITIDESLKEILLVYPSNIPYTRRTKYRQQTKNAVRYNQGQTATL